VCVDVVLHSELKDYRFLCALGFVWTENTGDSRVFALDAFVLDTTFRVRRLPVVESGRSWPRHESYDWFWVVYCLS